MSQQKTTISIIIKKRSKVFQPVNKNFIANKALFSMYFQSNQKIRKIIQLSSVTKSETRNQGIDDWEAGAALDGDLGEPPVLSSQPSSFMVANQTTEMRGWELSTAASDTERERVSIQSRPCLPSATT